MRILELNQKFHSKLSKGYSGYALVIILSLLTLGTLAFYLNSTTLMIIGVVIYIIVFLITLSRMFYVDGQKKMSRYRK